MPPFLPGDTFDNLNSNKHLKYEKGDILLTLMFRACTYAYLMKYVFML